MFFPSPSTWNMVKDDPNYVPMNMIGLYQTSCKILEDGDVPILPVVLSTLDYLQYSFNHYYDRTGIPLSTFWEEVNTICIWPYVQCQRATYETLFLYHIHVGTYTSSIGGWVGTGGGITREWFVAVWDTPGCRLGVGLSRRDLPSVPPRMCRVELWIRPLLSLVHNLVASSGPDLRVSYDYYI